MNKHLIDKNNLKANKITYRGNSIVLNTPLGLFILNNKDNIKTYDYLISRGFNYILPIVDYDNSSILFKYENPINYNINEKALDYVKLLSLLHNKTSYFINIKKEENKKIFDKLKKYIEEIKNYYDNITSKIENNIYYSPNEYLFIRNVSAVYNNIFLLYDRLEKWYEKYKNNTKKRVCTLYNNYDLNDLIKTKDNIYLYDFKKSYIDSPIYDLNKFYNIYFDHFDFNNLYKVYNKTLELNEYEKDLLMILNLIPPKIIIDNNIDNIYEIKKKINRIYCNLDLKKEKNASTH